MPSALTRTTSTCTPCPVNAVAKALRDVQGVQDVTYTERDDGTAAYNIMGKRGEEMRTDLAQAVIEKGWGLLSMEAVTMSLEDIFLRLTTVEQE